jgi:hypothetical protein
MEAASISAICGSKSWSDARLPWERSLQASFLAFVYYLHGGDTLFKMRKTLRPENIPWTTPDFTMTVTNDRLDGYRNGFA